MERLTEKTIGCFEYSLKNHKAVPGEFGTYDAFFDYSTAVKRLGHYEATGLEPEEIPQWIPVSERLPEDDETLPRYSDSTIELTSVLACGYLGDSKELSVQEVNRLLIKKTGITKLDVNYTGKWEWSKCFKKVVYWQLLPQPPKGEKPC